jgi:hypothetical protein
MGSIKQHVQLCSNLESQRPALVSLSAVLDSKQRVRFRKGMRSLSRSMIMRRISSCQSESNRNTLCGCPLINVSLLPSSDGNIVGSFVRYATINNEPWRYLHCERSRRAIMQQRHIIAIPSGENK